MIRGAVAIDMKRRYPGTSSQPDSQEKRSTHFFLALSDSSIERTVRMNTFSCHSKFTSAGEKNCVSLPLREQEGAPGSSEGTSVAATPAGADPGQGNPSLAPKSKPQRRFCWREDLAASRDLTRQQQQGFGFAIGWFEEWRVRLKRPPGRDAANEFWSSAVTCKERKDWQLDQWMEGIRWYFPQST